MSASSTVSCSFPFSLIKRASVPEGRKLCFVVLTLFYSRSSGCFSADMSNSYRCAVSGAPGKLIAFLLRNALPYSSGACFHLSGSLFPKRNKYSFPSWLNIGFTQARATAAVPSSLSSVKTSLRSWSVIAHTAESDHTFSAVSIMSMME